MRAVVVAISALLATAASAESVWVGRFDASGPEIKAPWKVERIDPRIPATAYAIREWDGVGAVEARADKSMAILGRPLEVDLQATPFLCWRWRIDAPVAGADMTKKSGDDYAARVYLNFDVPPELLDFATRSKLALGRTLYGDHLPAAAINYIWDNRHPVGTWQANGYTDRARMLVLRSGADEAGHWVSERRDVRQDFRAAFGELSGRLKSIALASDTDNTGETAHAGFADLRFVSDISDCPE